MFRTCRLYTGRTVLGSSLPSLLYDKSRCVRFDRPTNALLVTLASMLREKSVPESHTMTLIHCRRWTISVTVRRPCTWLSSHQYAGDGAALRIGYQSPPTIGCRPNECASNGASHGTLGVRDTLATSGRQNEKKSEHGMRTSHTQWIRWKWDGERWWWWAQCTILWSRACSYNIHQHGRLSLLSSATTCTREISCTTLHNLPDCRPNPIPPGAAADCTPVRWFSPICNVCTATPSTPVDAQRERANGVFGHSHSIRVEVREAEEKKTQNKIHIRSTIGVRTQTRRNDTQIAEQQLHSKFEIWSELMVAFISIVH